MSRTTPALHPEYEDASSSIEENINLPDYAQNVLEDVDLPVLILISHGHAPPLHPRPRLRFDVRSLPNPPKHIRDAYNGTSKRLQEWMGADERFGQRRDEIKREIEGEMRRVTEEHEKNVLKIRSEDEEEEIERGYLQEEQEHKTEEEGISSEEENSRPGDMDEDCSSTLQVGISCAMGRHRSVAMVEELAKMSWPGWRVEVHHRDLSKMRGPSKKPGRKGSRGTRGGGISSHFEDD